MINSLREWPPAHLCLIPSTLFLHLPVCVFSFLISTNLLSSRVLQITFFLSISFVFSFHSVCSWNFSCLVFTCTFFTLLRSLSSSHVQETEETFIANYSWRFHHYLFNNSKIRTLQVQSTHIKLEAEDFLYNSVLAGEAHLQSWIVVFRSAMGLLLLHLTITMLHFMLYLCFIFKQVILFF